jgi:hypothetical protein
MRHNIVWKKFLDVSEEYTACIFSVEEWIMQATSRVAILAVNYHRNNFYRINTSRDAERKWNLIGELLCWHCNNWNLTFNYQLFTFIWDALLLLLKYCFSQPVLLIRWITNSVPNSLGLCKAKEGFNVKNLYHMLRLVHAGHVYSESCRLLETMWVLGLQRSGAGLTRSSKMLIGKVNGTRALYIYSLRHDVTYFMEPGTSSPSRRSGQLILPQPVQCIHHAQTLFI